jgi:hypothetical protein
MPGWSPGAGPAHWNDPGERVIRTPTAPTSAAGPAALSREAVRAGGTLTPIDTPTTALSQHCVCGARAKKPLSQRLHTCGCAYLGGQPVHRDVMSAFLHTAVTSTASPAQAGDRFDPLLAATRWADGRAQEDACGRRDRTLTAPTSWARTQPGRTPPRAPPARVGVPAAGQVAAMLTPRSTPATT